MKKRTLPLVCLGIATLLPLRVSAESFRGFPWGTRIEIVTGAEPGEPLSVTRYEAYEAVEIGYAVVVAGAEAILDYSFDESDSLVEGRLTFETPPDSALPALVAFLKEETIAEFGQPYFERTSSPQADGYFHVYWQTASSSIDLKWSPSADRETTPRLRVTYAGPSGPLSCH